MSVDLKPSKIRVQLYIKQVVSKQYFHHS